MRISDWSSDVCSSDLPPGKSPPAPTPAPAANADPAEAAYSSAYALVDQQRWAEAEAALKDVVAKYPKHKRASYAQHWLGRTYLADNKPAMARSEERRVGQGCVSTCRSGGSP